MVCAGMSSGTKICSRSFQLIDRRSFITFLFTELHSTEIVNFALQAAFYYWRPLHRFMVPETRKSPLRFLQHPSRSYHSLWAFDPTHNIKIFALNCEFDWTTTNKRPTHKTKTSNQTIFWRCMPVARLSLVIIMSVVDQTLCKNTLEIMSLLNFSQIAPLGGGETTPPIYRIDRERIRDRLIFHPIAAFAFIRRSNFAGQRKARPASLSVCSASTYLLTTYITFGLSQCASSNNIIGPLVVHVVY